MNLYPQDIHHSVKKLEKLGSSGLILVRVSVMNKTLTRNDLGDKGHAWLIGYRLSCREIRAGVQGGHLEQRTRRKFAAVRSLFWLAQIFFLIPARTSCPQWPGPSLSSHQLRKFPHRTCL